MSITELNLHGQASTRCKAVPSYISSTEEFFWKGHIVKMADQAVENENIQAAADVASVEGEAGTAAGKRVADDNAEAPAAKKAKADSEAGAGEAGEEETVKVEETFEDAEAEAENEGSRDGEEVLKEPVRLGPKDFYSPTVTYNYFRDLVKFWARDVDFNEVSSSIILQHLVCFYHIEASPHGNERKLRNICVVLTDSDALQANGCRKVKKLAKRTFSLFSALCSLLKTGAIHQV